MKMAKASQADLEMAMELSSALDALEKRFFPVGMKRDDAELFDDDNPHHCEEALAHLLELYKRASLMRVVWGCAVMLDPRNRLVDPNADTIEHHPDRADLAAEVERLQTKREELRKSVAAIVGADEATWPDHGNVELAVAAHVAILQKAVEQKTSEVERLRAEHEGPDSWEANAKHLLARCPYTVRQCPGGGPEDIKSSLVVTFMGMQQDLAAERRKVDALQCRVEDLESSLRALLIHIDAYRMGWMGGVDKWRDRIGLADDVEAARAALAA